jgi:hypothetical protein
MFITMPVMKVYTDSTALDASSAVQDAVRIRAHGRQVRRLGHWTTARRFDVRTSRGSVVLDLRSTRIEAGDIRIHLDADHAMVKLLVPEDAVVDHQDVRRVGRCGLVDWSGRPAPGGRVIRIDGELRASELRVNRGGIAIVSAMLTREYLADLRQAFHANHVNSLADVREAYREGRWTTIDDPGRTA